MKKMVNVPNPYLFGTS